MKRTKRIYFIKPTCFDGPIKIGCSEIPLTRLEQLSTWSPWPLEIIGYVDGDFDDERFLHQCFFSSHLHREWFHNSPRLRDVIARILDTGSVAAVRDVLKPEGSVRAKVDCRSNRSNIAKVAS